MARGMDRATEDDMRRLPTLAICPRCHGTTVAPYEDDCTRCESSGYIEGPPPAPRKLMARIDGA